MTVAFNFNTCDLCDVHKHECSGDFRVLPPVFKHYGNQKKFSGSVVTIRCFEDNSLVKQMVEGLGGGRVLVIDGGGSLRKALVGGNLASIAARNGWAGLVVYGCVRDAAELRSTDIGIAALDLMPMSTEKRGEGQSNVVISVAGMRVQPGDWLYADEDGIVLAPSPLQG